MVPSKDPNSEKYRNDPNRVWYCKRWMTVEQIERRNERLRDLWAMDPERRERHLEAQRRPEYRKRQRDRNRERYATDPEYRERILARYWNLSGIQYNRRLLRDRRRQALNRMEKRNAEKDAA